MGEGAMSIKRNNYWLSFYNVVIYHNSEMTSY